MCKKGEIMQLDLNDKYRIVTDEFNFILQEIRKQSNSDLDIVRPIKYKDIGYYPTLESMTKGLLNREILMSNVNDFDEINQLVEDCTSSIVDYLKINNVEKLKN